MTHEEAISICKGMQLHVGEHHRIHEALNVAIEATTKQMPKKPIVKNSGEFDVFECPTCNFSVGFTDGVNGTLYKHCNHCGQAIDWSTP